MRWLCDFLTINRESWAGASTDKLAVLSRPFGDDPRAALAEMRTTLSERQSTVRIWIVYVGLGDRDQAMSWLNKVYEARFNPSILMRPAFDPLRSDVRVQDLLRRIGLP